MPAFASSRVAAAFQRAEDEAGGPHPGTAASLSRPFPVENAPFSSIVLLTNGECPPFAVPDLD